MQNHIFTFIFPSCDASPTSFYCLKNKTLPPVKNTCNLPNKEYLYTYVYAC